MRTDHMEMFNAICAGVAKLANEAAAEHSRQIARLESIARRARALTEAAGTKPERAEEPSGQVVRIATGAEAIAAPDTAAAMRDIGEAVRAHAAKCDPRGPVPDILRLAMQRVDAEDNPLLPQHRPDSATASASLRKPASLSDIALRLVGPGRQVA